MYKDFQEALDALPESIQRSWKESGKIFTDPLRNEDTIGNLLLYVVYLRTSGIYTHIPADDKKKAFKLLVENAPEDAFNGYSEREPKRARGRKQLPRHLIGSNALHEGLNGPYSAEITKTLVEKTPTKGFEIFNRHSYCFPLQHAVKANIDITTILSIIAKTPGNVIKFEIQDNFIDIDCNNREDGEIIMRAMRSKVYWRDWIASKFSRSSSLEKIKPATARSLEPALQSVAEEVPSSSSTPVVCKKLHNS